MYLFSNVFKTVKYHLVNKILKMYVQQTITTVNIMLKFGM